MIYVTDKKTVCVTLPEKKLTKVILLFNYNLTRQYIFTFGSF